jgi:hypothetical protein
MRYASRTLATKRGRIIAGTLGVIAIPLIALSWWLGSPLFLDKTVDEQFPLTVDADIPAGVERADAEVVMGTAAKLDSPMSETMPDEMDAATKVLTGAFRDADNFHRGSGSVGLYQLADGSYILRLEDLDVTNGPDLRVMLSDHPDPLTKESFQNSNYVELDKLKGNIGNQNYPIPANLDPVSFTSVVIYCKPFHVLFSVAPLNPA